MAGSPLCDGKRFADNLLAVMRGVWKAWIEQPGFPLAGSVSDQGGEPR